MIKNKINKKIMNTLKFLFMAEIPPYESIPKLRGSICKKLLEMGLIEEVEIKSGNFSIICHKLTWHGHITYCQNCPHVEEFENVLLEK